MKTVTVEDEVTKRKYTVPEESKNDHLFLKTPHQEDPSIHSNLEQVVLKLAK